MKRKVETPCAYLCARRFYTNLQRSYAHRERPLLGQNASALRFAEDQVLGPILILVKRPPLLLTYDGTIYEPRNIDDVVRILGECTSAARELGIWFEVKSGLLYR